MIDFGFGFADRSVTLPIMAVRETGSAVKQHVAEFSIIDEEETKVELGLANALILTSDSDVVIENGQYHLQPGDTANFTLIVLHTLTPEEQASASDLSLLVTHLPFTMKDADTEIVSHLNPSELQYYRTPEAQW
jgi:hypothetical protein